MPDIQTIFWNCDCSLNATEHDIELGDNVIICLDCLSHKRITEEIKEEINHPTNPMAEVNEQICFCTE